MEDPVVPLERNLYGHPLAGLLWERQFEMGTLLGKSLKLGMFFVNRAKGLISSLYVYDIKMAGRTENISTDLEKSDERH